MFNNDDHDMTREDIKQMIMHDIKVITFLATFASVLAWLTTLS